MQYRALWKTEIKVSPYCLGAMMFSGLGNPDHDDCIRIIHKALDTGINFIDTADRYKPRRVGGDRRQGAEGPARHHRAGHQGARADGRGSEPTGKFATLDHAGGGVARFRTEQPPNSILNRSTEREVLPICQT